VYDILGLAPYSAEMEKKRIELGVKRLVLILHWSRRLALL
jgi:hypothetical protein